MRGHIVKRYENSYTIVLDLGRDPATGKRKQQWVSVKCGKKEAEKKLSDLLHQLDTGTFLKPGKTTVKDYLGQWLRDYCEPNLAPGSVTAYEVCVRRHLIPAIGQLPLTALRPEHLQKLYSEKLRSGLGARSVQYLHVTIHRALKDAMKLGLVARNVADAVTPPHVDRPEMHTWGEGEIPRFLEAAKTTRYYPAFYLALFTGMRRSEVLALRWCDIDLLLCQLYVTRSLHCLKGSHIIFRQPKTAKGRRVIALTPSTVRMLEEYRQKQEADLTALGKTLSDDTLVCCDPTTGKPFLPDTVSKAWANLVKSSGLKRISLHAARHSHASLLLKQGIHPKVVQERLGHASISITLDTYSHVAPGLQEAAARKFDEVFTVRGQNEAKNKVAESIG